MPKLEPIPANAFGPGHRIEIDHNTKTATLYGANGHLYHNIMVNRADFERLCDELGIPRPPPK